MNKNILKSIQIIVGVLFIFSGLIKANDPLGLSYKMQEYFEVWGWAGLDGYTTSFAMVINTFEIIAGLAIMIGWQRALFSWLLLALIVFFSFLTGFAVVTGKIKTCGCLGDCLPISPLTSFIKDLVLLGLILVLVRHRHQIKRLFTINVDAAIVGWAGLLCILFQWVVLTRLPFIDCLPYKVGTNIEVAMQPPPNAKPDSTVVYFTYKKNGQRVAFDLDHLPADLDSTYTYIDRRTVLIRKGNNTPPISDFKLTNLDNIDTTSAILNQHHKYILFFIRDLTTPRRRWIEHLQTVIIQGRKNNIPVFVVSTQVPEVADKIKTIPATHFLQCDAVVIKTIARVDPTYLLMQGPVILGKYANVNYRQIF